MDKKQAQNIVVDTLQNSFDKERFLYFVKNFLNTIDESKAFHARGYVKDNFKKETGIIKTYERLGTYTDPEGKKIDILVVYLQKPKSIDKARTAQRDFVAHYLKDRNQKDAGLVAFVSPNPADWRFSLVKMEYKFEEGKSGRIKVKEEFTPAKRWSFLVGTHENSHTAQSRLAPLVEDDSNNPNLSQIEEAFNIEKVTKEFFEKYRELFFKASESLGEIVKKDKTVYENFWEISGASKKDDVDRFIGNFVKKLLGQIVFLYFLQKKGWFGVPMKKNWGDGDKKFLRTLFEEAQAKGKNYFNDYLEPLFYEALAKERDNDYYSRFNCKIPFLNGGLFDPISDYDWVNTAINLPDELFSNDNLTKEKDRGNGILDIFDRYNFTVKEDEPLEKEVAVDPEMLGKVFENLLEVKDRKSKGTYYTPREIVHYMCQESLVNYLKTETKVNENRIRQLVNQDRFVTEQDVTKKKVMVLGKNEYDDLDKVLKNIKIVDPACGSGAFLVGMLQEIVKAKIKLQAFNGKQKSEYSLREETIQNCIYGVDIDPGATEIAKLRLWLSLIVEEDDIKDIKPLPNLDYKIMQGNSLLEEFEGVKLFDEEFIAGVDTGKEKRIDDLKKRQSELSGEYIKLHQAGELTDAKKAEIDAELKKIMKDLKKLSEPEKKNNNSGLFDASDEAKEKAERLKQLHKEFFETSGKNKKKELKKQIEKLEWELIEATLKKEGKSSELKKLDEFKKSNTKPFFLWKLNFAEVFQEKGGFDIVIANPPYINTNDLKKESEVYRKLYLTAYGSYDIYVLFFEKSIQLLKENGVLTFITSNKYFIADYAKKLRFLLKKLKVLNLIDLADCKKVFENAFVSPAITIVQNNKSSSHSIKVSLLKDRDVERINSVSYRLVNIDNISSGDEGSFNIYIDSKTQLILNKIASNTVSLSNDNFFDVRTGIMGFEYWNMSPFISEGVDGDSGVRVVTNSHLDKYTFLFNKKINLYKKNFNNPFLNLAKAPINKNTKDFFRKRKIIIRGVAKQLTAQIDNEGYAFLVAVHAVFVKNNNLFDERYVLALLNSTLFNWLHLVKFYTARIPMGSLKYPVSFLKELPIKKISKKEQLQFINFTEKILKITRIDDYQNNAEKQVKVKNYEKKIDQMVYKLYGLTEEEIKIVEGNK